MDAFTHLLASYTVARAGRARIASPTMAVFLVAGLAPDIDWLWHLPAPLDPLRAYGTVTHSLAGAAVLAAAIGCGVWAAARRRRSETTLVWTLAAAAVAVGVHLLLDLCCTKGIELYWPFRASRISWNLTGGLDVILMVILGLCALLQALAGLVSEEIGGQTDARPSRTWPVLALVIMAVYLGARVTLHERAEQLLSHYEYKGSRATRWAAYASGASPFSWRGAIETDAFLAEAEVEVGFGGGGSLQEANVQFKPEPSAAVDAASAAPLARAYTAVARFPLLTLETNAEGTRAELTEIGDSSLREHAGVWHAMIDLDPQAKVTKQELRFIATR